MEWQKIWDTVSANPLLATVISGTILLIITQLIPPARKALGLACRRFGLWLATSTSWSWRKIHELQKRSITHKTVTLSERVMNLEREMQQLRSLLNSQHAIIVDNRSLILESRVDTYMRLCRVVAEHIDEIVDPHEPKLIVTLQQRGGDKGQYCSIKPHRELHENNWIADTPLSNQLRSLQQQGKTSGWAINVLRLDGTGWTLSLSLNDITPVFRARHEPQMIIHTKNFMDVAVMRSLMKPLMLPRETAGELESRESLILTNTEGD